MSERCELRAAHGTDALCDGDTCMYWRAVEHLGADVTATGCAVQAFELLDEKPEIVSWLLTVKERVEAPSGCERINV